MIEILVVAGIFILISSLGLFMTLDTFRGTYFRSERDIVVALLQKARSESMNNIDQSMHGFCFYTVTNTYVIFEGTSCISPLAIKELTPAGSGVTFTPSLPAAGIVFTQLSGTSTPVWSGTIGQNNKTSTLSINSEGTIVW